MSGRWMVIIGTALLLCNTGYIVFIQLPNNQRIHQLEGQLVRERKAHKSDRRERDRREKLVERRLEELTRLEERLLTGSTRTPLVAKAARSLVEVPASSSVARQCSVQLCQNSSCCGFTHPMKECGGCDATHACHPGAECGGSIGAPGDAERRRPAMAADPPRVGRRAELGHDSARWCDTLVQRGFCAPFLEAYTQRFCNVSCRERRSAGALAAPRMDEQARAWMHQSVFDVRSRDPTTCANATQLAALEAREAEAERCTDLEDETRLATRGFFVARAVLGPPQLRALREHVASIPPEVRMLCGVAGVQPEECMWHKDASSAWIRPVVDWILERRERWLGSGLARRAELGMPLEPVSGELITINGWGLAANASCVFQSLLNEVLNEVLNEAAAKAGYAFIDPCLANYSCPSSARDATSFCWLRCAWRAVMTSVPTARIRALVEAARTDAACAHPPAGSRLGSFREDDDKADGSGFWDVPAPPLYSYRRLVSEMRVWLTKATGVPLCQGFHDWHMDGPGTHGRYHKAFVMISKGAPGGGEAPEGDAAIRRATNLRLVPASERYASNCRLGMVGQASGAWLDAHSCVAEMVPGDVLIFREDVWHRTQDVLHDRNALIVDILRFPLASSASDLRPEEVTSATTNMKRTEVFEGVLSHKDDWKEHERAGGGGASSDR